MAPQSTMAWMALMWTLRGRDDLVPLFAHRHDHALHRRGGAVHHKKCVRRTEGLRRKVLRLPDDRHRMAEVVQEFHGVEVVCKALLPQKLGELRVAPSPLVAGHVEGHDAHPGHLVQGVPDGGVRLGQLFFQWFLLNKNPSPSSKNEFFDDFSIRSSR
jgi:hypothetical protein